MTNYKTICPHCKKEIMGATEKRVQELFLDVCIEGQGDLSFSHDSDGDIISSVFLCPECQNEIAKTTDDLNILFNN